MQLPVSPPAPPAADRSPRTSLAVVHVSGADADSFLGGQLTSHVAAQPVGRWVWSGWCTPKGRLRATFRLARTSDGWWLMLPAERAAPVATGLAKYVMRARANVRVAPFAVVATGVAPGTAGDVAPGAHGPTWSLADGRGLTLAPDGAPDIAIGAADVEAGAPWVFGEAAEAFLPQMVGLDRLGGVRSGAGCYPGQEIVNRTTTMGDVKRTLHRFALASATTVPLPGAAMRTADAGDALVGHVLHAVAVGATVAGLAVVDRDTAASGAGIVVDAQRLATLAPVGAVDPAC